MRFVWAVHPLRRTIGGRLPFKPATKNKNKQNKHKTRKPMPRKEKLATLQKQVSDVLDINKAFMHENEALQKMCSEGQHTIAWQDNAIVHDREKIKKLEKTIADQEDLLADVLDRATDHQRHLEYESTRVALSVNEQLRNQITRRQELAALDRERIAQQAEKIANLRQILACLGCDA